VGVRGTIGRWGWDIDDAPYAAPAAEVLAVLEDLLDTTAGDPLVSAWVTLVGHDLMSDDLAAGAADLARRRGTNLTFHISPSPGDAVAYLARTGRRPLVHLDSLGVLGPNVLLGHAVHLDDAEVELVLERGTAVASCPWAYLRLAQGITAGGRHGELVRRGGRIAIGCDSENAGDAVDVLRAAALFVGLARSSCSPSAEPKPSAWPTGSAASRWASRPTSWCTTPPGRSGILPLPIRCGSWYGRLTAGR
jgi:5-methylthioadenosine/S-adenosylhomocysteine deaminase